VKDSAARIVRVKTTPDNHIASFEALNAVSSGRWVPFATYTYDERGDLACATDADNHSSRYTYADDHRLATDTDRAGLCFHFLYTSTIIGARTMQQLDDNVGALDVKLTPEHVAALDKASTPSLPFPVDMLAAVPAFAYGGTTINGQPSKAWAEAPQNDSERF
jgi:hypothetical protein